MREILFRGKRVDNGEWVYGNYYSAQNSGGLTYHFITKNIPDLLHWFKDGYIIDPSTLGQYTGLKDKNGKKIFEGDIIRGKFPYGTIGIITWVEKRAGFMIRMIDGLNGGAVYDKEGYKLNSFKFEIIGNVHDNPELIK